VTARKSVKRCPTLTLSNSSGRATKKAAARKSAVGGGTFAVSLMTPRFFVRPRDQKKQRPVKILTGRS
jgi:hypothetical protein